MDLYEKLISCQEALSVVGLGYVGLPIAAAFSQKLSVVGFDVNADKIALYRAGKDPTREVGDEAVASCGADFTCDETRLRDAKFHIVAVPTPVNADHTPDLGPLESACEILGRNLVKGSVVVFESTVYPGVTQEVCAPILQARSGLTYGKDFKVGYSPERINPGDRVHRLENITKIVSGMDAEACALIAKVYGLVISAGVYQADSIMVAEAAKVIENSQRDINIAFMNELSIIFDKLGIDTKAVLEAAGTKWNFMKFSPGLVGGHCIGVDPYYLTYKAEQIGYHSQVILSGRRINDGMGKHVAENLIKCLIKADTGVKGAKVAILGLAFKENCPDIRNTRVIDIYKELREYGIDAAVADPVADAEEARSAYGLRLRPIEEIKGMDALILAVGHRAFEAFTEQDFARMYSDSNAAKVLVDVKGILNKETYSHSGYVYWRL